MSGMCLHTVVKQGETWVTIATRILPPAATIEEKNAFATVLAQRNGRGSTTQSALAGEVLHYLESDINVEPGPPDPPDPPDPPSSDWENEDKLIPPPGKILIGVSTEANYAAYLSDFPLPHINHRYATSVAQFNSDMSAIPDTQIPFVNYKPQGSSMSLASYNAIIAGTYDAQIVQVRDRIITYDKPMFIAIMHEPENDGSGTTYDTTYRNAYRHVADIIGQAPNAVRVWNMMGYRGHLSRLDNLFPGIGYVEWIAFDPYCLRDNYDTFSDFADQSNTSPYNPPGSLTWAKKHSKPIMLAEWGIGTREGADGPNIDPSVAILSDASVTHLRTNHPLVRALVYWNSEGLGNYVLSQPALTSDYADFLENAVFDVDLTPVLP